MKGGLQIQSQATDPVIELRVVGSQNQSIDCDPDQPNLRDEIENGCEPTYKINPSFNCPAYNALWGLPQPWKCVKTQTGGAVGQVEHGMKDRILGGANSCTAPINWPNFEPGDPRIVPLIITPFGSFSGSGNDIIPVLDFGAFYVVGWNGRPLPRRALGAEGLHRGPLHQVRRAGPQGAGNEVCEPDYDHPLHPRHDALATEGEERWNLHTIGFHEERDALRRAARGTARRRDRSSRT